MSPRSIFLVFPLSMIGAAAACGDDDAASPSLDAGADAAPEASGPVVVGSNEAKQPARSSARARRTWSSRAPPSASATRARRRTRAATRRSPCRRTLNATSPSCEQVPFPVEADNVTYTGNQKTEPGESLSFYRVFIAPPKSADAGTD